MELLIGLGVLFFIIYMFVFSKKKEQIRIEPTPYEGEAIFTFDLKGASFRDLDYEERGPFLGYVFAQMGNKHDSYAVGVYKENDLHIGFLPAGQKEVHDTLTQNHDNKIFAWGWLSKKTKDIWRGEVYVPLNYTPERIEMIWAVFAMIGKRKDIIKNPESSLEDYFSILNDSKVIDHILNEIPELKDFEDYWCQFECPSNKVIPTISKRLYDNKDWSGFKRLEQYNEQIELMTNKRSRETLLKRFELANKKASH